MNIKQTVTAGFSNAGNFSTDVKSVRKIISVSVGIAWLIVWSWSKRLCVIVMRVQIRNGNNVLRGIFLELKGIHKLTWFVAIWAVHGDMISLVPNHVSRFPSGALSRTPPGRSPLVSDHPVLDMCFLCELPFLGGGAEGEEQPQHVSHSTCPSLRLLSTWQPGTHLWRVHRKVVCHSSYGDCALERKMKVNICKR